MKNKSVKISSSFYYLRSGSFTRKNRRAARKIRQLNIQRQNRKPLDPDKETVSLADVRRAGTRVASSEINVGNSLSLFGDTVNLISVVSLLSKYSMSPKGVIRHINLNLSSVKEVDTGALSFLLAKVNEITKTRRVVISGDLPNEPNCKKYIEESGFLDYMTDLTGKRFERHSDNFLVKIGDKKTDSEQVGRLIKKCVKKLTGQENHYPPVYSILQEMSGNSVEHANISNKNWLLGVNFNYAEDGSVIDVIFTMTDVGFGILNTLVRKFGVRLAETLTKNTSILYRAFERKYGSSTEEINRNRGLPLIKDRYEKQYICDLKVITNDVVLDFNDLDNSTTLGKNFPGTFYYWKINKNCIDKWNTN